MSISLPEDGAVRGGVYLCQVGPDLSCGSCCGLYNIPDPRRDRLHAILKERTDHFARVPRTIEGILAFEQERIATEGLLPTPDFHHCVFVGLIQDNAERIGCLLHPLALGNGGIDWRGLSFYGGAACKHFFCPSYDELPARWKQLTREALTDWYEYGLIVVEHRLLAALFAALEETLGHELCAENVDARQRDAIAALLRVKLDWPFRDPGKTVAHNFFSTKETARTKLPAAPHISPGLHAALVELDTMEARLEAAHLALAARIDAALRVITAPK